MKRYLEFIIQFWLHASGTDLSYVITLVTGVAGSFSFWPLSHFPGDHPSPAKQPKQSKKSPLSILSNNLSNMMIMWMRLLDTFSQLCVDLWPPHLWGQVWFPPYLYTTTHSRLQWIQYVHICFNYPLAYLKYLGKYALTADVSAYVKYDNM